jgi:hypothetical protein
MKRIACQQTRRFAAAIGLLALLVCSAAGAARAAAPATPEAVIRTWPAPARTAAAAMLEKYGKPSQFDRRALVWFKNGIWKRTIVYRRGPRLSPRLPDKEFLQQTIGYIVPNDKLADLQKFNRSLDVSQTAGEMTFTSDREATNILALNLADEIVVGKKSVADARALFAKTTRLAASGKSSPYMEGFRFDVDNSRYMTPTGADR